MGKNERGQVGVVVAILMVSLFVAVIVLVQVYYVPNWMKDREAEHMDTVANQFSQIKASIDIETMAQRDMSLINSITLGSKELPFFVSARAFGSLNILSTANSDFQVSIEGTGLPSASISEDVRNDISDDLDNVRTISSFDLRLNGNQVNTDYFNASMGDAYVNITITAPTNGFLQLNLRVGNTSEAAVYNQPIAWIPTNAEYTVNLLDDGYKFSTRILPYLSAPFNISFNCENTNAGGFILTGSQYSGSIDDNTEPMRMGTIEYASENAYFVDQTYVYEGGAVILNQSQGQAIISAPGFSIQNTTMGGNPMHVYSLDLVDVTGLAGKTSVSGYGTYSIKTNYSSTQQTEYIASSLYVNITTKHTSAWQRYMNNTLTRAGIDPISSVDGNVLIIELIGPETDDTNDIKFSLTQTHIMAQVGPGWVS